LTVWVRRIGHARGMAWLARARRRIQEAPTPDRDPRRQRAVVDAFFAAARGGDFEALVAVLDPEVVHRSDYGTLPGSAVVRGPQAVPAHAMGLKWVMTFVSPAALHVQVILIGDDMTPPVPFCAVRSRSRRRCSVRWAQAFGDVRRGR
jgi:hypothetical protein